MKNLAFHIPTASLVISSSTLRFPVRRIFCVGRNYSEHAKEFGNDERDPPFFFTKPADAIVQSGTTIPYPPKTEDVHHEAELVVAIGIGGRNITTQRAMTHIFGFAAGNDLTRRDLQATAKSLRRPWDMSKGFDNSAIIGPILQQNHIPDEAIIRCLVDGEVRQTGQLAQMTWSTSDIIATLSSYLTLAPGDLIMTGTPAGVGPVAPGETCTVEIDGLSPAAFTYRGLT
jgi:fumarylpyruvate hydrolase